MTKKTLIIILLIILGGLAVWGAIFYWKNLRGLAPAIKEPPEDIAEIINTTGMPLTLPPGFSISILARNLPGARVIKMDALGNFWVSQTRENKITLLTLQNGEVIDQTAIFTNLNRPHGLVFDHLDPLMLYIAEEDKISRVRVYSEGSPEKIVDLPAGGRHFTRTLGFGPDDRLYVSIGSSCDTCVEDDPRRAKIFSMERDGSDFKEHARGLRNAVFFTWSFVDARMWATEMGRDFLGDDLPPDEINIVEEGKDYGWPYCYGKKIHDSRFNPSGSMRTFCETTEPSHIDIQAHSAPLGLAFVPEEGWPEEMWYDLIVAYHGSWNRTEPTGYKLVRMKLDENGNYFGTEDFISGWLQGREALGRPVDVLTQPGGIMYVSDDHAGVIYKITYSPDGGGETEEPIPDNGRARDGCIITGCSGQVCADQEVITTCEFLPEYTCYRNATCERQSDGKCGWIITEELTACLIDART